MLNQKAAVLSVVALGLVLLAALWGLAWAVAAVLEWVLGWGSPWA
jgi:hypothetical protein